MIRRSATILAAAFAGILAFADNARAEQSAPCASLSAVSLPNVTISIAETRAGGPTTLGSGPFSYALDMPNHCYVEGMINERSGVDGTAYGLAFALALPVDWNGRFLFQGGGGLNGSLNPPIGGTAAGDTPALLRGFAVVSTDGGHRGAGGFDASFMADQQAALDFAGQSVREVTETAQFIVAVHYGRPADYSYIAGCSTGGRESMLAAQRYPSLFDGAVVGAPAMRTGNSNFALRRAVVAFNAAAPRDAAGAPILSQAFSAEQRSLVHQGLLAQCDGLDGLEDGIVSNVGACQFAPAELQCASARARNCLSAAQVRALETAFGPLRNSAGTEIYPAYPFDTGMIEGRMPFIPGENFFSPGATPQQTEIDIDAEDTRLRADGLQAETDSHAWTNLSTFLGDGGKIMFYHGVSDAWFSAFDTLGYYQRAGAANADWDNSSRFYFVPGMGHCGGGANTYDQFDLLSAVVDWVENDVAPEAVTAARQNPIPGDRKLCPFPSYPFYRGGDPNTEESFECRAP